MLWLCYGFVMAAAGKEAVLWLACQPGENKHVWSPYGSLSLLPASLLAPCLPWVQRTVQTIGAVNTVSETIGVVGRMNSNTTAY